MQMLMTGDPITAQEAYRLGMVDEVHAPPTRMTGGDEDRREDRQHLTDRRTGGKACGSAGRGQPTEQAIAIMMEAHWRSAVHPDRVEGIGAFNDGREPTFRDSDY